jgi:glutamate-1-semialdehyde 2,1-aminomutase
MTYSKNRPKSEEIMNQSRKVFPGGVNSPVRAFSSVGGSPIVFERGSGKTLMDIDGNSYIDFCSSWGPLILGYSHPKVLAAVKSQAEKALTFGAPSVHELTLAHKMQEWIPGLEMLRFVSSGTEATMSAIRAARATTGRNGILKFSGCYHGHADCLLVNAGSGLATLGNPSSAGVPAGAIADTFTLPYNDFDSVKQLFAARGKDIAVVCIEPLAANMGLVLPKPGFLELLRELCTSHGSLLLFDEVMTGFRISRGGASETFGVKPDIWAFGKIIGGGLPAAAYGGKESVMRNVAPVGKAYQAGTLSGNPLAMVAGLATLTTMDDTGAFAKLESLGQNLDKLVNDRLQRWSRSGHVQYVRKASFFCFFYGTHSLPCNFEEVSKCDMKLFATVYQALLNAGIYLGPSGYEVGFLSTAHEVSDLERLVEVIDQALSQVTQTG